MSYVDRQAMELDPADPHLRGSFFLTGTSTGGGSLLYRRHPLDPADRSTLEGPAQRLPQPLHLLETAQTVGGGGGLAEDLAGLPLQLG